MRLYETTFILNPQADDGTLDQQVKAVTNLITNNGGKLVNEDRMGTRRLAYEVGGLTQGYYTSILFESEGGFPATLDRFYRLEDAYLRHLTILFEGDPEQVKERQQAMANAMEAHDRSRRSHRGGDDDDDRRPRRGSDRGDHRSNDERRPSERPEPRVETPRPPAPEAAPAEEPPAADAGNETEEL